MTVALTDRLVDDYLRRLRAEARRLPRSDREELLQQIQEHLDEAIPPGTSDAEVRNALERLGSPETIVAEERERLGIPAIRAGKLEWCVVFLLPFGAVVLPLIGWLFGVFLLWCSRVWTTREKLIGTLLPPGGLSAIVYLAITSATTCSTSGGTGQPTVERCSGGLPPALGILLLGVYVIGGIATPIFLGRRASATRT